MTWARFDDNTLDWPPLLAVSPQAQLLYYRMRIYFAKHNTKGVIGTGALPVLGAGLSDLPRLVEELVGVDLLATVPEGWWIEGWALWVPKQERDADERRAAARRGGQRSAETRRQRYGTAQPGEYVSEVNAEVTASGPASKLTRSTRERDGTGTGNVSIHGSVTNAPQEGEGIEPSPLTERPDTGSFPGFVGHDDRSDMDLIDADLAEAAREEARKRRDLLARAKMRELASRSPLRVVGLPPVTP
jgi:hypothetical protein